MTYMSAEGENARLEYMVNLTIQTLRESGSTDGKAPIVSTTPIDMALLPRQGHYISLLYSGDFCISQLACALLPPLRRINHTDQHLIGYKTSKNKADIHNKGVN